MDYVASTLAPGERIVYQARHHWFIYAPSVLWLGAAILLQIFDDALGPWGADPVWGALSPADLLAAFCAIVAAWRFLGALLYATSTELAVTDRRVVAKFGLVRRRASEINVQKIEGVEVVQTILGRILGYGSIAVRGTGGGIAPVPFIADPMQFRQHVPTH